MTGRDRVPAGGTVTSGGAGAGHSRRGEGGPRPGRWPACLSPGAEWTRSAARPERGQASVELLGAVPALLVLGLVALQLLAVGYSQVLAGGAAEAGALSLAAGGDASADARRAVPGWARAEMRVAVAAGTVRVRLRPPSPIRSVARRLEVQAAAAVEAP